MADRQNGKTRKPPARKTGQLEREQLRALSRRVVQAQESERRAIAYELHNVLGQSMTVLKLLLDRAMHSPPEGVAPAIKEAQEVVDEVVARVRNLSLELLPSMLDDLGLLPTLLWLCQQRGDQTAFHIDFKHAGIERKLPPDVATAAYRIVQEAVANAAYHSRSSEVLVRAWADDRALFLHIEDHGAGFDPAAVQVGEDCGLAGMKERALAAGGSLTIESTPGTGTIVAAELPLSQPTGERR